MMTQMQETTTDHGDNGLYLVRRTGGKLIMRRFTENYEGEFKGEFKEWSSAEVDAEREKAAKSEYAVETPDARGDFYLVAI